MWYDMMWYDMIWYDTMQYDMIWYDTMRVRGDNPRERKPKSSLCAWMPWSAIRHILRATIFFFCNFIDSKFAGPPLIFFFASGSNTYFFVGKRGLEVGQIPFQLLSAEEEDGWHKQERNCRGLVRESPQIRDHNLVEPKDAVLIAKVWEIVS